MRNSIGAKIVGMYPSVASGGNDDAKVFMDIKIGDRKGTCHCDCEKMLEGWLRRSMIG